MNISVLSAGIQAHCIYKQSLTQASGGGATDFQESELQFSLTVD